MLTDSERALPRRMRRAITSRRRTLIKKKEPFGRVKMLDIEQGDHPRDARLIYRHFTKGLVDRRLTDELAFAMIG